jgi:hypothetical protein
VTHCGAGEISPVEKILDADLGDGLFPSPFLFRISYFPFPKISDIMAASSPSQI